MLNIIKWLCKINCDRNSERPRLLQSGDLFHNDNASAHTARMVTELLDEYEWSVLENPRYSPDVAPCHLWLIRGYGFESREDIIATKEADKDPYVTAFESWYGGCKSVLTMVVGTLSSAWEGSNLCQESLFWFI
ncbi:histone-lysine N-methyltransferase SETMAR-like protein [Plakobranchus ocellatus]|uniref:Histone-lysine N-methyltransferase SETMAR-like protein n=1 Tax=Plakobranchus ocellatus TaxID=259542 RepID=A0AAV4AIJ2_9GAST|nr:histone-lysine N-methyltransferase SETMAR-like protein [Plakobranchus ocellatus]